MYNLEKEKVRKFLNQNNFDRVAVQIPEGLRDHIGEIDSVYREENIEAVFIGETCYGSCDLSLDMAESLDCDALIHYGHSDMGISSSIPILYVEARMEFDPFRALKKSISELRGSKWGLITTVQHIHYLDDVETFLKEEGVEVLIGSSGPRSGYDGQILGCDWGSATSISGSVDGFVYIGTGDFHPQGVSLVTGKPVVSVNPVTDSYSKVKADRDDFFKKRAAMIESARSGEKIGLIVSNKPGQERMELATDLSKSLIENGYSPYIVAVDNISPSVLENYQFDALVNTACPRISLDDTDSYSSPVLTPVEARILTGETKFDDYRFDEIGRNF